MTREFSIRLRQSPARLFRGFWNDSRCYLLASDVSRGESWASTRMKKFRIDIIFYNDDGVETITNDKKDKKKRSREELDVAVFERLGILHRLERLDLLSQSLTGVVELKHRMSLGLRHGLGLMKGLGRLEVLSLSNQQVLENEEVSWMKTHWEKPRKSSGSSHLDAEQMRKIDFAIYVTHVEGYCGPRGLGQNK